MDKKAEKPAGLTLMGAGIFIFALSAGGQTVTVSVAKSRQFQTIRIKDAGSGMDRETLDNIFVPFYIKKRGGTGLGMAIAKKVIEGHKGKIAVESEAGKGTEVLIELPYKAMHSGKEGI